MINALKESAKGMSGVGGPLAPTPLATTSSPQHSGHSEERDSSAKVPVQLTRQTLTKRHAPAPSFLSPEVFPRPYHRLHLLGSSPPSPRTEHESTGLNYHLELRITPPPKSCLLLLILGSLHLSDTPPLLLKYPLYNSPRCPTQRFSLTFIHYSSW